MRNFQIAIKSPIFTIWATSTDVGKTAVSYALAKAAQVNKIEDFLYLKPIQTGFPIDEDANIVARSYMQITQLGQHATNSLQTFLKEPFNSQHTEIRSKDGGLDNGGISQQTFKTLFAWLNPLSVHQAQALEKVRGIEQVQDDLVVFTLLDELQRFQQYNQLSSSKGIGFIETAGGVCSPTPQGQLQVDMYRPLQLPNILVGDGRLGGISQTISCIESMQRRLKQIPALVLPQSAEQKKLGNADYLREHLLERQIGEKFKTTLFEVSELPRPNTQHVEERFKCLEDWTLENNDTFQSIISYLMQYHDDYQSNLATMKNKGWETTWWPTCQHKQVEAQDVHLVLSRNNEWLQHYIQPSNDQGQNQEGYQRWVFDGTQAWWTQGVTGIAQRNIIDTIAQEATKYSHILLPQNVNENLVELNTKLLNTVGSSPTKWADKVFYCDGGSAALEVAIKMGFRKFQNSKMKNKESKEAPHPSERPNLGVLGLQGGYHGDTLGCMNATSESAYNISQTPWYKSEGLFIDPPKIKFIEGSWALEIPDELKAYDEDFQSLDYLLFTDFQEIFVNSNSDGFDQKRLRLRRRMYEQLIQNYITQYEHLASKDTEVRNPQLGVCMMEPVLQGASGMVFVDPEFQRAMAQVAKQRGLPLIFDEVFVGTYRLGIKHAQDLLGVNGDIACYAKLLTAGLAPMAVTLASQDIFDQFLDDDKANALLQGHSYCGYPIGTGIARKALDSYCDPLLNPNIVNWGRVSDSQNQPPIVEKIAEEVKGIVHGVVQNTVGSIQGQRETYPRDLNKLVYLWEGKQMDDISCHEQVKYAGAIGTVFWFEIVSDTSSYSSLGSRKLARELYKRGVYVRPIGNVIYIMCNPFTTREHAQWTQQVVLEALNALK